jgi:hypothetical protein
MRKAETERMSDTKTAPRGEVTDKAHAARKIAQPKRNSDVEETFNSSKNNADSHQTPHLK